MNETENQQPDAETPAEETAMPEAEEAIDPAAVIDQLTAERDDMRDRLMRLAADMENLRKRTEREIKDAKQYSVTGFARDVLAIGDNLQRALDAVPAEQREGGDEGLQALINGVEMTAREMGNILQRHGVTKIEPKGEKFDPNFHQAMFEVPSDAQPNGTVVEVVQAGYIIAGRVLRPAMVGVSKGAPAAAPADTPAVDKSV